MVEVKNIQSSKKIYITENLNSLDTIICESLIGKCEIKVIIKEDDINSIIDQYELVVISSLSKFNTNIVYKRYLNSKFYLFQLDYLDFEETGFNDKEIYKFTFYNLELLRLKSFRSKCLFTTNNSLDQVQLSECLKIFGEEIDNISGNLIFYLYKIYAFNSTEYLQKYCFYLNNLNKEEIPIIIDLVWRFTNYFKLNEKLCKCFIDYFLKIKYIDHQYKKIIFENLVKFYENF